MTRGTARSGTDDRDGDGTHPSDSGRQKVAEQVLHCFTTDEPAQTWFVNQPSR